MGDNHEIMGDNHEIFRTSQSLLSAPVSAPCVEWCVVMRQHRPGSLAAPRIALKVMAVAQDHAIRGLGRPEKGRSP